MKQTWIVLSLLPVAWFFRDVPDRESGNLTGTRICDTGQDGQADTILGINRSEAAWGDVVFNEIMYDPEPPVDLTIGEYLELYNRSPYFLDMKDWRVLVGEREYELGPVSGLDPGLTIGPGQYFVLPGIVLPNQGAVLALWSREGCLVHAVKYGEPYNAPDWKKEGGWSLESPDPDLACNTSSLWEFSNDRSGGTPGRLNSVDADLEDRESPVFLYFGFGDTGTIHIQYSEPVLWPGGVPGQVMIQPGNISADRVVRILPLGDRLLCHFGQDPSGLPDFTLRIPGVQDCQGNLSGDLDIRAGAAAIPAFRSVLVNEIMYDPSEGKPEFIELFNPGSRFIDLEDLALDVVEEGASPDRLVALSDHSRVLGPGSFLVLSRDIRHLRDAYNLEVSGCWAELKEMKTLPNSGGWIFLADRSGNMVDLAAYGDPMHMELINDTKGISLERIAWDRPGNDPANWHSAASVEGFATPGKFNSQSLTESRYSEILNLEPAVFSPDDDGFNDLLGIYLSTLEQGSIIRLWITDLSGNTIRSLANNHITGPGARYVWDGEQDDGRMAGEGLYVVHVRGYHPVTGNRWDRKAAAAVIYP